VELALRQHGVVGREQLRAMGLGRRAIAYRLRTGRLHAVHARVYTVGAAPLTREGRFMAAGLACGARAVLSHRSAADLWGMRPQGGGPMDVTVRSDRGRNLKGIRVHRSAVAASEVTTLDGIPVTKPARTLVDLADLLPRRALERAIDEAEYLRLDYAGLAPRPGRRGSGKLIAVLAEHRAGGTRTRSELEERFLDLSERHGVPRPEGTSRSRATRSTSSGGGNA
jgi:predicted transcriptional regulator of viral defense system